MSSRHTNILPHNRKQVCFTTGSHYSILYGERGRTMAYDKALIAGKLRRWEKYLIGFRLPAWEDIPDFGLYMEQVVDLLKRYLDYMPPELKEEDVVTSSAINNYVRRGIMPGPRKKKYYRLHIAYLIMICALKQSLNMVMIMSLLPQGQEEEEIRRAYDSFV